MESRRSWVLYGILVACRVVVAPFLTGYVHPDEFFQGGQELWFGCPPVTPWEFQPKHALRSVMPPTTMTWLPLSFYAWMTGSTMSNLSGMYILVIPRIFCGILSVLTVDTSVWYLSCSSKRGVPTAVLILASAWPAWVLLNRPFTNALETMLLALLLAATNQSTPHRCITDILVGFLCAFGLWTRFTFVFVALPTMLFYLYDKAKLGGPTRTLLETSLLAMGFCVSAAGLLYADVVYYKGTTWTSLVTPLNALLYNSKVENLQEHGLHPRWTHALVNMLLLYGPMALVFYVSLSRAIASLFVTSQPEFLRQERIRTICLWTVASGLGFLSMAPHQEPRFLLPLLVPLVVVCKASFQSARAWLIWILFNAILLFLYGVLHQGGVVPSLVAHATDEPRAVLYYHTYMPPTFVSRNPSGAQTCLFERCIREW